MEDIIPHLQYFTYRPETGLNEAEVYSKTKGLIGFFNYQLGLNCFLRIINGAENDTCKLERDLNVELQEDLAFDLNTDGRILSNVTWFEHTQDGYEEFKSIMKKFSYHEKTLESAVDFIDKVYGCKNHLEIKRNDIYFKDTEVRFSAIKDMINRSINESQLENYLFTIMSADRARAITGLHFDRSARYLGRNGKIKETLTGKISIKRDVNETSEDPLSFYEKSFSSDLVSEYIPLEKLNYHYIKDIEHVFDKEGEVVDTIEYEKRGADDN